VKLSADEKRLFQQANRVLTNMSKRTKDKNVENALEFAKRDLNIFGKHTKFAIDATTTERQKNALLRSAQKLIDSPYATKKGTENLYKKQRDKFAERYGLTTRQASKLINLFDAKKNPEVARAWERIRNDVNYQAVKPFIKDDLSQITSDIGDKKFGLMMRLFNESGLQGEENYNFAVFLKDDEIVSFFENNDLETLADFVNNKEWE